MIKLKYLIFVLVFLFTGAGYGLSEKEDTSWVSRKDSDWKLRLEVLEFPKGPVVTSGDITIRLYETKMDTKDIYEVYYFWNGVMYGHDAAVRFPYEVKRTFHGLNSGTYKLEFMAKKLATGQVGRAVLDVRVKK